MLNHIKIYDSSLNQKVIYKSHALVKVHQLIRELSHAPCGFVPEINLSHCKILLDAFQCTYSNVSSYYDFRIQISFLIFFKI